MKFSDLKIITPILKAVAAEGYTEPSPIQAEAIPLLLEGNDLLGCAQTGTGKTAAFAIPILQKLHSERQSGGKKRQLQALILTPTRELAIQIHESFEAYGRFTGLKFAVIFGGVSQNPQVAAIKRGIDVLVATPGRLNDLIGQGLLSLDDISIFVLDEADRMLDLGFVHDVKRVIARLPSQRQTLLFSATMPAEIAELSKTILRNPKTVAVTPVSSTVETIEQSLYFVDKVNKPQLLIELLRNRDITRVLVFARTKHGSDKIVRILTKSNVSAKAIHGNKSQNARQSALADFKSGAIRVLVATDIAARGIDVEQLSHVINYDLPNIPETYVHRIGRTGRAGMGGIAISFCDFDEKAYLKDIQKLIGFEVPVVDEHPFPMEIFEHIEPKTQPRPPKAEREKSRRSSNNAVRISEPRAKSERSTAPRTSEPQKSPERAAAPKSGGKHNSGGRKRSGNRNSARPMPSHLDNADVGGNRINTSGERAYTKVTPTTPRTAAPRPVPVNRNRGRDN